MTAAAAVWRFCLPIPILRIKTVDNSLVVASPKTLFRDNVISERLGGWMIVRRKALNLAYLPNETHVNNDYTMMPCLLECVGIVLEVRLLAHAFKTISIIFHSRGFYSINLFCSEYYVCATGQTRSMLTRATGEVMCKRRTNNVPVQSVIYDKWWKIFEFLWVTRQLLRILTNVLNHTKGFCTQLPDRTSKQFIPIWIESKWKTRLFPFRFTQ